MERYWLLIVTILFAWPAMSVGAECLVVNGGFEDDPNIIFEEPNDYGYWAGNFSEVVGTSDGITPIEGSQMLHFIHAAYGDYADESMNGELWQIIDISGFADLIAAGGARAWGWASFNRVAGDPNTDTEFLVQVSAYQGDPCDFWELDELASESSSIISDGNTLTWEYAATSLRLPADTNFIVVKIAAVENVFNDTEGVEFDGHYGDAVCVTVGPARIYVDANAPGPLHNGSSWEMAFQHVQDALAIAQDGDQIWVAEGTYKPDEDSNNPGGTNSRNATFQLLNGVEVYGGFPSGGGEWQQRDHEQYETILSGDIGVANNNGDNSYHVVTGSSTEPNAVIDGFTITGGSGGGGGMYNNNGSPSVLNCTFISNLASGGHGGGMYNETSSPTVVNCRFLGNESVNSTGGMYNKNSSPKVVNCVFSGNIGDYGAGMGNSTSSNPTVSNCTFSGNTAREQGGGIYNNSSNPTLANCILWGNTDSGATDESAQMSSFNSTPIINYSCVLGWTGALGGTGNIGDDPCLVDADGADDTAGSEDDNLRLPGSSACIDAGDNSSVPADTADLDGDGNTVEPTPWDLDGLYRIVDGDCNGTHIVDMGAYEYSYEYIDDAECLVVNGGFEDDANLILGDPDDYGYWAGNFSEVVGVSDAITPVEGLRMLHFIHAGTGDYADESVNGELWQIIDVSAHSELIAAGKARAWGQAYFNRVEGDPNTDTEFLIDLAAYQGDPCDFWQFDELASESVSIDSDSDLCTWEDARTSLLLPSDTNFVVVRIAAVENVFNDHEGVEFDGHYGDAVCVTVGAGPFYVDTNAPGPLHNGLTWETAFLHVQDALGVASYGDEIWVAEGTYKPDSNAANPTGTDDSNATFALVGGAAMYGGFPSGGGEWDDRDPEQYQTILSGDINTPDDANDNSYHVVSATLVDSNTILDGFVITAGNAMGSSYPNDRGGGMWIYNNADPGIANCVFTGNEADYYGGGMTISAGSPTVDNCLFANNSAESIGGGMVITHDNYNAVITNCTFRDNSAGVWGGAIYGGGLMVNCRFLGNASNYGGAAFLLDFSGAEWVNCIFSGNSAIYDGGAFRSTVFSSPALANCTFSGNSAGGNGGAISSDVNCHPVLTNCILWGNTATNGEQIYNGVTSSAIVSYSDVQDGYTGIGNISEDPLFSDANGDDDTAGTQDDNLRLSAASPCIDLGDNNSVPPDGTDQDGDGNRVEPTPWDLDGRDRIVDGDCNDTEVVDMGAYEFSYAYIGDFDDDCDVDLRDFSIFALAWLSGAGDGQYNPDCDISLPPDEFIDWRDLRLVGDNWLAGK